jgi:glycosyltransferase involved in cell wall biosynthesis
MLNKPVLIVAPSRHTRGGITAVVSAYESSWIWKRWNCVWIETQIDRSMMAKIYYFAHAMLSYIYWLPKCQLVHIHLSEPFSALRKAAFAVLAILMNKPVIMHFHSFSPDTTINSKWRPLYKFLFSRAKSIFVLSPYWQNEIAKSLGKLPVVVIPNPCPDVAIKEPSSPLRPYIFFAGTLNARKGYADLIQAFSIVAQKYPEWDLVLAGNGELQKARTLAEKNGIDSRIRMPGWISNELKEEQFRNAAIFCLPSYAEGFPMAILDAMAYGLPIVVTPVGGIPDILENNKSALIVEPGDVQGLADHLAMLMSSQELRTSLSHASIKLAHSTFSLGSIVERIDDLYSCFSA